MSDSEYTKHTTHTDALDTLGSIIGPEEKRDAIHLAVYPVVAGEDMVPGGHVKLGKDGLAWNVTMDNEGVGIVDPFLWDPVEPGERFWLVVYPREISSLRHEWEHPAFPPSRETETESQLSAGQSALRAFAEERLRRFAENMDLSFEHLVSALDRHHDDDDWVSVYGMDAHGDIPDYVWDDLETYLGRKISVRPKYFSCSC